MGSKLPVVWTEFAENQLDEIFDFYSVEAGFEKAHEIVLRIIKASQILGIHPELGQIETLLKGRKDEIRYLLDKNFKILYFNRGGLIVIVDVFDTRMNPETIKRSL
jgi:toxin ParE1/3/4